MKKELARLYPVLWAVLVLMWCGCGSIIPVVKGNRPYTTVVDVGATEPKEGGNTDAVNLNDEVVIDLDGFLINDVFGNDTEREILILAGIIREPPADGPSDNGVPVGLLDADAVLSDKVLRMIDEEAEKKRDEIMEQMRKDFPGTEEGIPVAGGTLIDSIKKEAKNQLLKKLTAEYSISVNCDVVSFGSYASLSRKGCITFAQASPADTVTESGSRFLLFRGKSPDTLHFKLEVQRKSLIAEQLQKGVDKLKDSHVCADLMKAAFAGCSAGAFGEMGNAIGSWMDDGIYQSARNRYQPAWRLAEADFEFSTGGDGAAAYGRQLQWGATPLHILGTRAEEKQEFQGKLLAVKLNVAAPKVTNSK